VDVDVDVNVVVVVVVVVDGAASIGVRENRRGVTNHACSTLPS
jgi:hypothetical protein